MADELRMNLAALQQRDPYITEIVDKAAKVALYKFSQQHNKWSLTGIEGSLFVYKRSASPSYGLMILNRRDLNNLVQPLTPQVEFHLNTPFLLYKKLVDDPEDAILGIWFVDRAECLRLTEVIQTVLREVSGRSFEARSESDSGMGSSKAGHNILSLLSNAQNKYDQERGSGQEYNEARPIEHPSGDASGMSQISLTDLFRIVNQHKAKAGMMDSATETGQAKNPMFGRSMSVTEVEAQAQAPEGPPVPPSQGQGSDSRHPILRMISTKTVEEIERQHLEEHKRSKKMSGGQSTPSEVKPIPVRGGKSPGGAGRVGRSPGVAVTGRSPGGVTESSEDASMELMQLLGQGGLQDSNRSFIPVSLPSGPTTVSDLEHNLTSLTLPAMPDAPMAEHIHLGGGGATTLRTRKESTSASSGKQELPTLLKPSDLDPSLAQPPLPSVGARCSPTMTSLLTPLAFTDGGLHDSTSVTASSALLSSSLSSSLLLPPLSSLSAATSSVPDLAPLTREQLQQAMLHLIKNDNNFVTILHAAYLDSFHAATGNKG